MPIFTIIQDPFEEDDDQNVAVIFSDDFVGSWNFSHRSWFSPPTRFAIKIQKNSVLFHPPRDAERKIKTSGSQTKWFLQRIKWWLQVLATQTNMINTSFIKILLKGTFQNRRSRLQVIGQIDDVDIHTELHFSIFNCWCMSEWADPGTSKIFIVPTV